MRDAAWAAMAFLAADVARQVFLLVAEQAGRLVKHPALVGWLYTATRNPASNIVRAEQRRIATEQKPHVMHEPEPRAEAIDWGNGAPLREEALDTLSANDRSALLLRFIDRRSFYDQDSIGR